MKQCVGKLRTTFLSALAIPILCALGGCHGDEVGMLTRAAAKIATAEIAKFNAIELMYKDTVEFDGLGEILPNMDYGNGVFVKRYRVFTGYELKDITKTDSIMAPRILTLQYDYDFMTTKGRGATSSNEKDPRNQSEKDTEYEAIKCHLIRRYHCDAKGNFVGKIGELPPRETYYRHGGLPPETSEMKALK